MSLTSAALDSVITATRFAETLFMRIGTDAAKLNYQRLGALPGLPGANALKLQQLLTEAKSLYSTAKLYRGTAEYNYKQSLENGSPCLAKDIGQWISNIKLFLSLVSAFTDFFGVFRVIPILSKVSAGVFALNLALDAVKFVVDIN